MLLFVCLLFRLFFFNTCRDALHTRLSASILKLVVASYAANSDDQISVVTVTTLLITY